MEPFAEVLNPIVRISGVPRGNGRIGHGNSQIY